MRYKDPRGFFCERTAEYLLVSRLVRLLSDRVARVVPLYYWSTREGNTLARASLEGMMCKAVAVYARRPKISEANQTIVLVKFNDLLFRTASIFNEHRIPVFAGLPGVSSLRDLTQSAKCYWFCLHPLQSCFRDVHLRMDLNTEQIVEASALAECVEGPINEDLLVKRILEDSDSLPVVEVLNIIAEAIRRGQSESAPWNYRMLGGYKPFHLLIEPA